MRIPMIELFAQQDGYRVSKDSLLIFISDDAIGNQTQYGRQYLKNTEGGNSTRIQTDGFWNYLYDANGNRTSKKNADESERWVYGWDLYNRLIKVEQFVRDGAAPGGYKTRVAVSYQYDAENFRVSRTSSTMKTESVFAYSRSGALLYEKTVSSAGEPETRERSFAYVGSHVVGWEESLTATSSSATEKNKYYALTDHLGSVTMISDTKGAVLWESEYLTFGNLAGAKGEILFDGLNTGKDIDAETGLTYHWNRWRSEDGASFISEDPARFGINWYGYAGNNPLKFTDPTGLCMIGHILSWPDIPTEEVHTKPEEDRSSGDDDPDPTSRVPQDVINYLENHLANDFMIGVRGATNFDLGADQFRLARISGNLNFIYYLGGLAEAGLNIAVVLAIIAPDLLADGNPDMTINLLNKIKAAGNGTKLLNPPINITEKGLQHVLDRHSSNALAKFLGKSQFDSGVNIPSLINSATQSPMVKQANGNFARIFDAGARIGVDRASGIATSIMTVITRADGSLVTAFPGRP